MIGEWDGIDEFVAVATTGNFTRGGALFGASTTHMSRAVVRLETRLQCQLFSRTTRNVSLTDAGRTFFEHCQLLMRDRDEAIAMMSEQGEPQGELKITCSTAMGERFVAAIVQRYAEEYKKLNINLELTNRLVDLVGEGFDLAIRTGKLADSRLISTRIASRSLITCASREYLASVGNPSTVSDLSHHECLVGTASIWRFKDEGKEFLWRPKGRLRCNSGTAVVAAALSGMGVCQLPEFYVVPHLTHGRLVQILPEFKADDEPIWAVYPQRRHLLPKITKLIEIMKVALPKAILNPGESFTEI